MDAVYLLKQKIRGVIFSRMLSSGWEKELINSLPVDDEATIHRLSGMYIIKVMNEMMKRSENSEATPEMWREVSLLG